MGHFSSSSSQTTPWSGDVQVSNNDTNVGVLVRWRCVPVQIHLSLNWTENDNLKNEKDFPVNIPLPFDNFPQPHCHEVKAQPLMSMVAMENP